MAVQRDYLLASDVLLNAADGSVRLEKVPTTPSNPAEAALAGVDVFRRLTGCGKTVLCGPSGARHDDADRKVCRKSFDRGSVTRVLLESIMKRNGGRDAW